MLHTYMEVEVLVLHPQVLEGLAVGEAQEPTKTTNIKNLLIHISHDKQRQLAYINTQC